MQFMAFGTATDYAKRDQLLKKAMDRFNGIDTSAVTSKNKTQSVNTASDSKMADITSKLEMGQKLTFKELEYLRINNPQLYQKVLRLQQERTQYEKQLRQCKTKDEVTRLNMQKNQQIMAELKNADSMEDKMVVKWKMAAMQDASCNFTKSSDYQKLPTEAEIQAAKKKNQKSNEKKAQENDDNSFIKKLLKTNNNDNVIKKCDINTAYENYLNAKQQKDDQKTQQRQDALNALPAQFEIEILPQTLLSFTAPDNAAGIQNTQFNIDTSQYTASVDLTLTSNPGATQNNNMPQITFNKKA